MSTAHGDGRQMAPISDPSTGSTTSQVTRIQEGGVGATLTQLYLYIKYIAIGIN